MNEIYLPKLSQKKRRQIVWTLLFLMPIVGMAVDLVAPSLPAIASSLQVSSNAAKNVISIYLLGYAFGNFVTGFLTDALGRQKLMRFALIAFVLISLIPLFLDHIEMLLLTRFLQGIALGAIAVLARATLSDILPSEELIRLGTLIGTMWGIGPVIGPVIGGYLQFYFGWKAGFCFFAIVSLLGLIATICIVPETHFNRHFLSIRTIKINIIEVCTHRLFMALVILMGLVYSLIIVFNTIAPFLIQKVFGYTSIFYGHLALSLGLVFLFSTFICRFLIKKYPISHIFFIIINGFIVIALLAVITSYFLEKSIFLTSLTSALMFFACGFIFPLSMGKGMSLFRHIAGTATALMYFINVLTTSLVGFMISFIHIESTIPLMWIYLILLLIAAFFYWSIIRKH